MVDAVPLVRSQATKLKFAVSPLFASPMYRTCVVEVINKAFDELTAPKATHVVPSVARRGAKSPPESVAPLVLSNAGADQVLQKPLKLGELVRRVRQVLDN